MATEQGTVGNIDRALRQFSITNRPGGLPDITGIPLGALRGVRVNRGDRIEYDAEDRGGRVHVENISNLTTGGRNQQTAGAQSGKQQKQADPVVVEWIFGEATNDGSRIHFAVHITVHKAGKAADGVACQLNVNGSQVQTPVANPRTSGGQAYFRVSLPSGTTEADLVAILHDGGKTLPFVKAWEGTKKSSAEATFLEVKFVRYLKDGVARFSAEAREAEDKDRCKADLDIISSEEVVVYCNGQRFIKNTRFCLPLTGWDTVDVELPKGITWSEAIFRLKNRKGQPAQFLVERG